MARHHSWTLYRNTISLPALLLGMLAIQNAGAEPKPASQWSQTANLTVRESWDNNVFLQNTTAIAHRESVVTSVTPAISVGFQESARFKAALAYSADLTRYHSESSENHVVHRGSLNFSGKQDNLTWEFLNSLQAIAGSDQGPIFLPGGDICAAGGIPLRERRDALVYRGFVRMTWVSDQWMLRPVVSRYDHDFQTQQRARTGAHAGYENYIDRSESSVGLDVGRKTASGNVWMIAGHRFGRQQQGSLLGAPSPYSNKFHRLLLGVEGTVAKGLKLSVAAGPDFRKFDPIPGFHRSEILWFVDATLTATPTATDTFILTARRFEQPGFASFCVYEDCTYELAWRRKIGSKLTLGASAKTYITDFQAPANREDWIVTPSVTATYALTPKLLADFGFLKDRARSRVPHTTGRDYTRQLFSVGLKYTF